MIRENYHGITLMENESIEMQSHPSKLGLWVAWLSVPSIGLVLFLTVYLPNLLRLWFSKAVREAVLSEVGADTLSELNVSSYIMGEITGSLPKVVVVLVSIPIVLLCLAWLVVCVWMTKRHFGYELAITNLRVIGKARNETFASPTAEIKNVFIEQSLWGKIFKYATITVQSRKGTKSFYNIANPDKMYKRLKEYAEAYSAY